MRRTCNISAFWEAYGQSRNRLLSLLDPSSRVAIWGAGLNGLLVGALLEESGISVRRIYDARRAGTFLGLPVEKEPNERPDVDCMLVCMDGPQEEIERISAFCASFSLPVEWITSPHGPQGASSILDSLHRLFTACAKAFSDLDGPVSVWGTGTNGKAAILLLLGCGIEVACAYDRQASTSVYGVEVFPEPSGLNREQHLLICMNGPLDKVGQLITFAQEQGVKADQVFNNNQLDRGVKLTVSRIQYQRAVGFLYVEGSSSFTEGDIEIRINGKRIGAAATGLSNLSCRIENAWKFELQALHLDVGVHQLEAVCLSNNQVIGQACDSFGVEKCGNELINAETTQVIFFTHPSIENDQTKNRLNKQTFLNVHRYLSLFGYKLVFVNYFQSASSPSEFDSVRVCEHSLAAGRSKVLCDDDYATVRQSIRQNAAAWGGIKQVNPILRTVEGVDFEKDEAVLVEMAAGLDRLIETYRPKLFLHWAEFNMRTRLTRTLLDLHGVPSLILHEGFLPETWQVEKLGEVSHSYPCRKSMDFQQLRVNEQAERRTERILDRMRGIESRNVQQRDSSDLIQQLNTIKANGKKIVLYLGCNDWLMGMQPSWLRCEEALRSPFVDSYDALSELIRQSEINGWHLVFKPHPHYQSDLLESILNRHAEISHLTITYLGNVMELIQASDVVVSLMSSGLYEAMLHDTPAVLLGDHPMRGKGICYELNHVHELASLLEDALRRLGWAERRHAWRTFVARMASYYLFPQSAEMEALMGKTEEDIVRFMLKQVEDPDGQLRVKEAKDE